MLEVYADFCENCAGHAGHPRTENRQGKVFGRRGHLYHRVHDARPQGPSVLATSHYFGDGFARAFDITLPTGTTGRSIRIRPHGAFLPGSSAALS
jgi:hypothetical protein